MTKVSQKIRMHSFCLMTVLERELNRKKYIESLESRTQDEILEEEALFIELKRLEQSERDFARERDELLRVLDGVESGLASVAAQSIADEEEFNLMLGEGKAMTTKKRKGALEVDSPLLSAGLGLGLGTSVSAPPVKKARTAKEIAEGQLSNLRPLKKHFDLIHLLRCQELHPSHR